jgi:hypothetical protein
MGKHATRHLNSILMPSLSVWFMVYVCFLLIYHLELTFFAVKLQACDHSKLDMRHRPIGMGLGSVMCDTGLLCAGTCANNVIFSRSKLLALFCSKGCRLNGDWWEAGLRRGVCNTEKRLIRELDHRRSWTTVRRRMALKCWMTTYRELIGVRNSLMQICNVYKQRFLI